MTWTLVAKTNSNGEATAERVHSEISTTMSPPPILKTLKKITLISLGMVFLGIGIIGFVVPGLPGTIWLIISAALFIRSSPKLYNFVVNNRFFGRQVKSFLETGAIPARAKILSLVSIWGFTTASVLIAPYGLLFDILILLLAAIGTLYILSRPTKKIPQ